LRQGENALDVIERVKAKLRDLEPGFPEGVKIVTTYDRSELILRSIENLKGTLLEEMVIVSLVILIFLWHIPSALIPVLTIPLAVIISFIPMQMMGLTSNIMSLGGIAIAIGAMVDAAIVVIEQTHKKLYAWEQTGRKEDYQTVVLTAVKEVGGPAFFALLVIVSKNPVHSVLYLIVTFFTFTIHYILLNAQFLAIVNFIVYMGAIMVLFLFVLMLLNLNEGSVGSKSNLVKMVGVIAGMCLIITLVGSVKALNTSDPIILRTQDLGLVKSLGRVLFSKFLLPFEISSILLLTAMVGAVLLAKKDIKHI